MAKINIRFHRPAQTKNVPYREIPFWVPFVLFCAAVAGIAISIIFLVEKYHWKIPESINNLLDFAFK